MSDLQPADECECRYLFTIVRDFGKLALKEVDVGFDTASLPHLDGEEVIVILGLLARGVLGEKRLSHLRKVVESMAVGVEPIRCTFQAGRKSEANV